MALQRATRSAPSEWSDVVPDLLDAQCGYCAKSVAMEKIGPVIDCGSSRGPGGRQYVRVHTTYLCPRTECLRPSVAFFMVTSGTMTGAYIDDGPFLIPRGQPQPMDGLPDEIQNDRREAWSCFYGGDLRASIIMGRAAIQRAVRQLEGKGAGLKAEINGLHQRHKITEALKDAAHEVRISGDDAAHPEDLADVTTEEAKDSLDFMDDFLEHAIAMPARSAARKLARKPQSS